MPLESSLLQADFLRKPDISVLQALVISAVSIRALKNAVVPNTVLDLW